MANLWLPDNRFECPDLFISGRKPNCPVEIEWEHWAADKLVGCFMLNHSMKNLTGKTEGQLYGTASYEKDGVTLDASGEYIRIEPYHLLTGDKDSYSLTMVYRKEAAYGGGYPRMCLRGDTSGGIQIYRNNADLELFFFTSHTITQNLWDGNLHILTAAVYKITTETVNERKLFIDGVKEIEISNDSVGNGSFINSASWLMIGNRNDGTRWNGGGNKLILLHDRYSSDEEIKELHRNIYQFLIPR